MSEKILNLSELGVGEDGLDFVDDIRDRLRDVVAACIDPTKGDKGKITAEVEVELVKGRNVRLTASVKAKIPGRIKHSAFARLSTQGELFTIPTGDQDEDEMPSAGQVLAEARERRSAAKRRGEDLS